ncbi:MAG TPA: hypothetical protein DCE18_15665 [Syntrophobacteraceae bacterium]|jgi:hypothetical protein|nr:hypothetical protein [Syntrophobacteraceae bacterium]
MSILSAIPVVGAIIERGLGIIDQLVEDKDQAAKLKAEFQLQAMQADYSAINAEIQAQAQIVAAEAQGQSWLQRNWRPVLMLVIVAIVANNYIIYPYLELFGVKATPLELPERMWSLMQIGVGGYVVGRSAEKVAEVFKK